MTKVLEIEQLRVNFKTSHGVFHAVKGIDLAINKAQILGLIGESGSGKSVASQSITRLIQDAELEGKCLFSSNDKTLDLLNCSEHELREIRKRKISYIFQEPMTALNPLISCGDQIAECLENKKDVDRIKSLLAKVELFDHEHILKSYPHELSGGQRQRVMIAMALAKSPDLLIADEPTTALDIAVQNEILQLLKELSQTEQLAILFITHDLLSLKDFADNIAVMYHGEIVEFSSAHEVLINAKHPYTKALLESRANYNKKGKILAEINDLLKLENGELVYQEPKTLVTTEITPGSDAIIEVKDLVKWHEQGSLWNKNKKTVLKDVDFQLFEGDSLGLIGESGSGKSTIAKILLSIWKASKGSVNIYGKELQSLSNISEKLQLVFQDPFSSLNPKHKVGHSIAEVIRSIEKTASIRSVTDLLELVGLDESAYDKYPHEFSGGQRQRICIAKALAKEPKIIVLDEAVSALDVSVQAKILNLLNELKVKKKLTYLLISHDMNVVSYFCNRILVLRNGEVVEYGNTDELVSSPRSEYTRSLLEHSIY